MAWNDEVFRELVDRAARRLGKTRTQVLREAGIGRGALNYEPAHGRVTAIIDRLIPVLNWTPDEALTVLAQSFELQDDRPMRIRTHGLRETLLAISAAALRMHSTLAGAGDSPVTLEVALALVGEMVRARSGEELPSGLEVDNKTRA